ncbi:MAG: nucleotidyltransferase domain-containing protein [candidate division NC10 bacterium]|nr:nucleotidyltransferase domain-containing protein [candidate division NC10 bacterium]
MPVRSWSSPVLKWPDAQTVDRAVRDWAERMVQGRPEVVRIGYFGSYARGDWGVGSDLDLLIVVKEADVPFERRGAKWDATNLPVPADVLVHTEREWQSLAEQSRFHRMVMQEAIWVYVGIRKQKERIR